MRGVSDGRKKKKQLSTTERALKHVVPPIDVVMTIEMLFPEGKNGPPDHVALKQHFLREGRLTKDAASELIQRATLCLSRDKNLLQIKVKREGFFLSFLSHLSPRYSLLLLSLVIFMVNTLIW